MVVIERFDSDAVLIDFRHDLRSGWRNRAVHAALSHSIHVLREASLDPGNAEGETRPLDYRVVPGPLAKSIVPDLYELYASAAMLELVANEFGHARIETCPDEISGFNINVLVGRDSYYKWHIDLAPYTLVFFVTTAEQTEGGTFRFKRADGTITDVAAAEGHGIVINGSRLPHCVTPLLRDLCRVTVAAEYVVSGESLLGTHEALGNYVF